MAGWKGRKRFTGQVDFVNITAVGAAGNTREVNGSAEYTSTSILKHQLARGNPTNLT